MKSIADNRTILLTHEGAKVITARPSKSSPLVDQDTLTRAETSLMENSHVYVHCHFNNPYTDALIRIWKTTFLVDSVSSAESVLVHAEKISFAPQWTLIPDGIAYSFLLIFSPLPKACKVFDFIEKISQPGGFEVRSIQRNETDVYHINLL